MFLLPLLNDSFIKQLQSDYQLLNLCIDNNYCIINFNKNMIIVSIFVTIDKYKNRLCRINFYAISCELLLNLMDQHKSMHFYVSFSHALYLGKEIYKMELSNIFNQGYVQS